MTRVGRRSAWPAWGRWRIGLVKPCPSWRLRSRQGATPEALRQASVRRSSGRSTSVPPSRGYASSQSHALVAGTFRVSAREPEREIVRWVPVVHGVASLLANRSIAASGRAAPGRRPPRGRPCAGDEKGDQPGNDSPRLIDGDFRVCENRRHSGGLGWCARVSVPQFPHFRSRTSGFGRQSLLGIFQFPFRRAGDRFDM